MGRTSKRIASFILNNRNKIGEGIYLLYFALMIGARAYGLYEGMAVYNATLVVGMLLFLTKMVVTEHSFKEYIIVLASLLVAGIVYLHTGEKGLLVCFTMLLGMKCVSVKKTIETGIMVAGTIIFVKLFLGVFGLASEIYYPQERAGIGLLFRHSLGYAHPNTLHMNVLMLSMLVVYLFTVLLKDKNKNNTILLVALSFIIFLFNLYVFQYSGSRTGVLACVAYLVVNFWLHVRKELGLFEKIIAYMSFPLVCFVAIVLPFLVSGKVFDLLNATVFHSRFGLAKYFWSNNGVSLWGIRLSSPDPTLEHYGIDMAQLYLFLQLGIVAFLLISILTIWFIYECFKHDRRAELAVLMGMLFLGMWEPLLYNLGFKNFVYVFMGAMLYGCLSNDYRYFEEGQFRFFDVIGKIQVKQVLRILSLSIVASFIVTVCYMMISNKPSALYGDREQGESGNSFGMEALYLSEAQVDALAAEGDIIIGYVDESVPMYRYDEEIALMEYNKRVISIGVWSGLLVVIICTSPKVRRFVFDETRYK